MVCRKFDISDEGKYKMSKNGTKTGWIHGLWWVVANALGWAIRPIVGMAVGALVFFSFQSLDFLFLRISNKDAIRILLILVLYGGIFGAFIGILQRTVLRLRFNLKVNGWVWATILGLLLSEIFNSLAVILAVFSGSPVDYLSRNPSIIVISIIGASLALGVTQWYILRRTYKKAGLWVAATGIGMYLASTPSFISRENMANIPLLMLSSAVVGLIYGVVTAIAAAVIIRQSKI